MTREEILLRFPRASEATIRANLSIPVGVKGPGVVTTMKPKRITVRLARVPRSRNGGKWTEAQYWQAVRSALRRGFRYWKPITDCLRRAKTPFHGSHGQRFAYLCAGCNKLFKRTQVQVDHITPCGQLRSLDHVADFLRRLTAEKPGDFQTLCTKCHNTKTTKERKTP